MIGWSTARGLTSSSPSTHSSLMRLWVENSCRISRHAWWWSFGRLVGLRRCHAPGLLDIAHSASPGGGGVPLPPPPTAYVLSCSGETALLRSMRLLKALGLNLGCLTEWRELQVTDLR